MIERLIEALTTQRWGWPFRWLMALLRLSATRAQQRHQAELIGQLRQQLDVQQQLMARLEQQFAAAPASLPFSIERPSADYLEQAEVAVGVAVSTLSTVQKEHAFYSYYSEMYGSQVPLLESHYREYLGYLPQKSSAPLLDIGCGAGEFLRYLAVQEVNACGIDLDAAEAQRCNDQGLQVVCADALDYLPQATRSFSAITLFQVIEHMAWQDIRQLLVEVYAALEEGGCFIAETINLRHPLAFSGFYTDPTHKQPISDELLCFMFQWAGFKQVSLRYLMPVPVQGVPTCDETRTYYNYAVIGYKRQSATAATIQAPDADAGPVETD